MIYMPFTNTLQSISTDRSEANCLKYNLPLISYSWTSLILSFALTKIVPWVGLGKTEILKDSSSTIEDGKINTAVASAKSDMQFSCISIL